MTNQPTIQSADSMFAEAVIGHRCCRWCGRPITGERATTAFGRRVSYYCQNQCRTTDGKTREPKAVQAATNRMERSFAKVPVSAHKLFFKAIISRFAECQLGMLDSDLPKKRKVRAEIHALTQNENRFIEGTIAYAFREYVEQAFPLYANRIDQVGVLHSIYHGEVLPSAA